MTFTDTDKKTALVREIKYRRRVYRRRVQEGRMSQKLATYQIAIFVAIANDYKDEQAAFFEDPVPDLTGEQTL